MFVPNPNDRLPTVTSVYVPKGVEDVRVRRQLLDEFGIEIAGGIGPLKGKIWRIGLMGYVSQAKHILFFLAAWKRFCSTKGLSVSPGAGVGSAIRALLARRELLLSRTEAKQGCERDYTKRETGNSQ